MIENALFILAAMPAVFLFGLYAGTYHLKHMAVHGGEERFPRRVQRKVKRYRELKPYYVESRRRVENDDD